MSRSRILFVFPLLMSLVMLLSAPALAQFEAGLQGTVQDKTGAVVAGATVTATDDATGISRTATSNSSGFYRISELPPGTYTVTVEGRGFKKSSTAGVVIQAELLRGLDVTMDVGQAQETVNVTELTQALDTEDATISGTLTAAEVESLPALNRDPYELLRLAPGIFGDGARFSDGRSSGFPNGPGANGNSSAGPGGSNSAIFQVENQQPISSNGQRITSNDYLVDGVSVNSLQWGGAATITPSIESVQEITVLSNDYDASDGRSSGAHIKTITKGGTNSIHGGGVFQYHDPGLNAYNKFNGYQSPTVRDDNAFRQFAGTLGGPIIKNKLFFFFNYEGLRSNSSTFENTWVETPQFDSTVLAARMGTPLQTILTQKGVAPRVSQVIAAQTNCDYWNSAGQPCAVVNGGLDVGSPGLSYGTYIPWFGGGSGYPPNYVGGGLVGIPDLEYAQVALPATTTGNQYNIRMDYTAGKNLFSANTFLTFFNTYSANAGSDGRPMADYRSKPFSPSGFLSWVRTISPTMINEARLNFTRYSYNDITANPQINWAIPLIEIQDAIPTQGTRIKYGAVQGDTSPGILAENTFAFRDVLSKVVGNKAWKFGFEFAREQNNDALIGGARPDQVMQGLWNYANGTPIFEQIEVNPATGAAPVMQPQYFRTSNYGLFAQNDWKLRPNLTVNLGLRWEFYGPPTEAKGHLANFEPTNDPVNGLADGKATNPSQMWNANYRNFGPRLGFAWSPTKYNSKMVFRGGLGIAYDRFDDVTFDNSRDNPPYVASYGICCGTAGQPYDGFGDPFVNGQIAFTLGTSNDPRSYPANNNLITPINPVNGLPTIGPNQNPVTIYSNPTHMPSTYVYLYSTQMQYSLPKDWVMTVGYQGSTGHHLTRIKNLLYFYPNPNPDVNNFFTPTPDTNSNFNALNTQLEHRFHHGISFNMLYTYSKSIDQLSSEGPGFSTNQTYPINDHTERGPSDYDATHNFRMFGVWELPVFRGRNDFMGKVAGGWQLNGIFQFHSGLPWTPVSYDDCPTLGSTCLSPTRPIAYSGGAGHNAETSAFLPPVAGNFPNGALSYFTVQTTCGSPCLPDPPGIGRNSFRGPRYQDVDLSIAKQIGLPSMKYIAEASKIELRLGAYNVFNKLNLAPFTFGSNSTTVTYCCGTSPGANSSFGTATNGLAGRVLELQARFSF